MNRILTGAVVLILTLVLLIAGCSTSTPTPTPTLTPAPAHTQAPQVGKPAPDFQLPNLEGQAISLSGVRGKPVLLNFWATWCGPCRAEMPYLQQVYEEWSGKGLEVLAINIGESPSEVKRFLQTYNLSLPVLLDTKEATARKYNITGIPTTFFIDKDGIIQEKIIGAFPSKGVIEKHLVKIIP